MLKKSCLLEYLIAYAETLKEDDGKKALSANYFVISVLKTVDAVDNNQIPAEIDNEDAKKELADVRDLFRELRVDRSAAIMAISEKIKDPDYQSFMDEIVFGKIGKNAEERAEKDGRDTLDSLVYLKLIFAEPTDAIRKHVLLCESAEVKKKDPDDFTARLLAEMEELVGLGKPKKTEEVPTEEKKDDLIAEFSEEESEQISLADIVQTTRNIQNLLL